MDYYSLKMRASQQVGEGDQKHEQHISGAERIVSRDAVEAVCSAMARRAMTHSKGDPDFINIKIEKVCEKVIQNNRITTIIGQNTFSLLFTLRLIFFVIHSPLYF